MAGLSGQQLSAVAWLRWRLLLSSFRKRGAGSEVVARIMLVPLFALFAAGPIIGAGFAGYYAVQQHKRAWFSVELWIIFLVWQFIGLSASTAGPGFDLSTLTRFPIRFRDYLLVRLSFGLLDPPTLLGGACLISMAVGIGLADPKLLPWAALVLFLYGLCNVLFSRMIFSWLEKWLARRRSRELVGVLFILVSLGFQALNPILRHVSRSGHPASRGLLDLLRGVTIGASFLPPALGGVSIAHMQRSHPLLAVTTFSGVCLYMAVFLSVLSVRLRAQYGAKT